MARLITVSVAARSASGWEREGAIATGGGSERDGRSREPSGLDRISEALIFAEGLEWDFRESDFRFRPGKRENSSAGNEPIPLVPTRLSLWIR